ncbi:MAG: MBL fold metallo-hydrolase [Gammaproteobacteria bacterium]|nr:MAG: MBL fold metallo-hydrolase [Deltaproteobacteria bacterium]PIE48145.1 MAG: MBL fold metallo-hydrolase [Gammaproteobacteria bacterium]
MDSMKLTEGIYNVGVRDWNIRDFHGYSTHKGTTYNAFLIVDEKIVLIDTVKKEFGDKLLENISSIVDPKKIDMVISNHSEMDHTGSLTRIMHFIGEEKPVLCSKLGKKNIEAHFGKDKLNLNPVKSGEEISTGSKTLSFLETRMLHWPDSMFTYAKEDKILFSSDAFGQHYSGWATFDDELSEEEWTNHAKKYYANILLPFSGLVKKVISDIEKANLEVNMICPDHGLIFRKDQAKIIGLYKEWSELKPSKKAVIIYDSMWNSTRKMAEVIAETIADQKIDVISMNTRKWDRSEIITEVLDAGAVLIGSPTLNNNIFPALSDILTYMKGLKPKNKIGAAFGSYGWSGEAVGILNSYMEEIGFDVVDEGIKVQYIPEEADFEKCRNLGLKISEQLNNL